MCMRDTKIDSYNYDSFRYRRSPLNPRFFIIHIAFLSVSYRNAAVWDPPVVMGNQYILLRRPHKLNFKLLTKNISDACCM